MTHKLIDMIFVDPLGYYGDIEMASSSCCNAAASVNNFCIECGNRICWYKEKRTKDRVTLTNIWSDREDGSRWECSHCKEQFNTYLGVKPKWCANCGGEAVQELIKFRVKPAYAVESLLQGDLTLIEFDESTYIYTMENEQGQRIEFSHLFVLGHMQKVVDDDE